MCQILHQLSCWQDVLKNRYSKQYFRYIMDRTNYVLKLDDGDVCFVLEQHTVWNFSSAISMSQQSAGRCVTPLNTLSPFRANQSLFLLLNTAYLAEMQQRPILFYFFFLLLDINWCPTHNLLDLKQTC
jgi:hypothetical protein